MRPSSRHCTVVHKPVSANRAGALVASTANGTVENGGNLCEPEMRFPTSSKSLSFAPRPGFGQVGAKCIVKANHFFAELPDKDLNQYDVSSFLSWGLISINMLLLKIELVYIFFSLFLSNWAP